MGSSHIAGLKCLQWLFRGIQFVCSVVILGIYSYFLATMVNHNITVPTGLKAVEGISIIGTVYTLIGFFLVCCLAGHVGTSFIALVLDLGLIGGYIYIAVANRDGASSCSGSSVGSPYGTGDANSSPSSSGDGIVRLPTYAVACRMESACLAAACVAILFFVLSIFLEFGMNRNRSRAMRPKRDGDGQYLHKSDYYRAPSPQQEQRHAGGLRGLVSALPFRRQYTAAASGNPDALPMHQQPSQYTTRHEPVESWGEVQSLHDSDRLQFNDGQEREAPGLPRFHSTTAPRPAADSYNEGDEHVADREYNLYQEDARGNDLSETGRTKKQREDKAARIERLTAAYN